MWGMGSRASRDELALAGRREQDKREGWIGALEFVVIGS